MARIVLADDHEVVRRGIRTILERHPSFEVCGVATNGQEAVERVLEVKPDVIIMDLSMPVLSGFEATLKIRRQAPRTKIVVFSVHESAEVEQVAYLLGADAYVRKNSSLQDLVSTVNSILENPGRLPSNRAETPSVSNSNGKLQRASFRQR